MEIDSRHVSVLEDRSGFSNGRWLDLTGIRMQTGDRYVISGTLDETQKKLGISLVEFDSASGGTVRINSRFVSALAGREMFVNGRWKTFTRIEIKNGAEYDGYVVSVSIDDVQDRLNLSLVEFNTTSLEKVRINKTWISSLTDRGFYSLQSKNPIRLTAIDMINGKSYIVNGDVEDIKQTLNGGYGSDPVSV